MGEPQRKFTGLIRREEGQFSRGCQFGINESAETGKGKATSDNRKIK